MGWPCPSHSDRTLRQPEQRRLQLEQQHIRRFEILKSTPLGLLYPQNLRLEVSEVHLGSTGSNQNSPPSPKFVTSNLKWWKEKMMLPPPWDIFPCKPDARVSRETPGIEQGDNLEDTSDDTYPFAHIEYPGWQGLTRMTVKMTMYQMSRAMHYNHSLAAVDDAGESRSRWSISRVGYKREYILKCTTNMALGEYKWHSLPPPELVGTPALEDGLPLASGNLVLCDSSSSLIAVYKQRRDYHVLGTLTILTDELDHQNLLGNPVETIVASCLAIVLYERIGWQNLLGD